MALSKWTEKSMGLDLSIYNPGDDGEQTDSRTDGPPAATTTVLHATQGDLAIPSAQHELETSTQIRNWLGSAVYRFNEGLLRPLAELRLQERSHA
jgi:hypothetical protein